MSRQIVSSLYSALAREMMMAGEEEASCLSLALVPLPPFIRVDRGKVEGEGE